MKTRSQSLQLATEIEFDLAVIGGGIAGAGVAQDAASRGLSVVLIEKDDFASGTSSKTTKLIHGGLRYLEQFQFKLTQELCHERSLLEKLAPHLVRDFSFILPLTNNFSFFALKASLGLSLYDLLSWSNLYARHHKRISKEDVLEYAPALNPQIVKGGLRFHDCVTDDARMVLAVLKSAESEGAVLVNYLEVVDFELKDNKVNALRCRDRFNGQEITVNCKTCVNATGVWSDDLYQKVSPQWKGHIQPSKGIHIIVPSSAFETHSALFLPTQDGRYVFVVPWQKALMIGTTDRPYSGELDKPIANLDEIDYLLSVINSYTDTHRLNRSDITGSFAGLRPLVKGDEEISPDTKNMLREHIVFEGPAGIIGLSGGKLTNYRIMAGHVMDLVIKQMPDIKVMPSCTDKLMLGGFKDKTDFLNRTASIVTKGRRLGIEPAVLDHIIANYGVEAQVVVDIVEQDSSLNERICPDFTPILAEIPFVVTNEMAVSLEDVMHRRLRLGLLNQKQSIEAAPKVAGLMGILLKWDNKRIAYELSAFEDNLNKQIELTEKQATNSIS